MFFYDHAMARDDLLEQQHGPMGELDMLDGLRAMTMFKRDQGPLGPLDINQDVKHALASHPDCIIELATEGFLSEQLVRELEQMVKDSVPDSDKFGKMLPSGMIATISGPYPSEDYTVIVKSKNSKGSTAQMEGSMMPNARRFLL